MSPVCSHPSPSMVEAEASGLFRYPFMTIGPRIKSSPACLCLTTGRGIDHPALDAGKRKPDRAGLVLRVYFGDEVRPPAELGHPVGLLDLA